MTWLVCQTFTGREQAVGIRLAELGIGSYLPRIRLGERPASLWPGYLLVEPRPQWSPIRWCPGVVRLLMTGDRPAQLADEVVRKLQKRERKGIIQMPARKPVAAIEPGQTVRITSGSFTGLNGLYQGQSAPDRVRVLLELLGQLSPVDMPADAISPLPGNNVSAYKR